MENHLFYPVGNSEYEVQLRSVLALCPSEVEDKSEEYMEFARRIVRHDIDSILDYICDANHRILWFVKLLEDVNEQLILGTTVLHVPQVLTMFRALFFILAQYGEKTKSLYRFNPFKARAATYLSISAYCASDRLNQLIEWLELSYPLKFSAVDRELLTRMITTARNLEDGPTNVLRFRNLRMLGFTKSDIKSEFAIIDSMYHYHPSLLVSIGSYEISPVHLSLALDTMGKKYAQVANSFYGNAALPRNLFPKLKEERIATDRYSVRSDQIATLHRVKRNTIVECLGLMFYVLEKTTYGDESDDRMTIKRGLKKENTHTEYALEKYNSCMVAEPLFPEVVGRSILFEDDNQRRLFGPQEILFVDEELQMFREVYSNGAVGFLTFRERNNFEFVAHLELSASYVLSRLPNARAL